jgi:hypothetical protein
MRLTVAVTLGTIALLGAVSGTAARDASDRGGSRLESEELRNDIREQRLKKPTTPLWQTAPNSNADEKPKQKDKKK